MQAFIVAELSKNWIDGYSLTDELLAETFERVIGVNRDRGYVLHSFQLHRLIVADGKLNETIIAVFQQAIDRPPSADASDPYAADPGTPSTRDRSSPS